MWCLLNLSVHIILCFTDGWIIYHYKITLQPLDWITRYKKWKQDIITSCFHTSRWKSCWTVIWNQSSKQTVYGIWMQCAQIKGFVFLCHQNFSHDRGHTSFWNARGGRLIELKPKHIHTFTQLYQNGLLNVCERGALPQIFVRGFQPPCSATYASHYTVHAKLRVLMQTPPAFNSTWWTKYDWHCRTIQKGSSLFFFIPPRRDIIWGVEVLTGSTCWGNNLP